MPRPRRGAPEPPPTQRVGVYCRKSTQKGLEQDFNSLAAQQEAVEAYVKSQKAQGWVVLPQTYHDGGFSGGNTDRPAFQALMRDVRAGEIDIVAVYRLDRLSRSQRDFLETLDEFNRHGVQFVSVTERFDTTSSIGRFTLSIVVAVAELERETISQRTRDKMGASRRRGQWCGGAPVFGYRVEDKKLVVDPDQAAQVRETFRIYVDLESLAETAAEMNRRGWTTRQGRSWNKANVRALLTNPTLIGKVRYEGEDYEGLHEAIIDLETWEAVKRRLKKNRRTGGAEQRNKWGALLKGKLTCAVCGSGMTHHYTSKGATRYRYYVCDAAMKCGAATCPGSRVSAAEIEPFVVARIREVTRDPALLDATLAAAERRQGERRPALVSEARLLDAQTRKLEGDRRGLLDALPQAGKAAGTLTARIAELDDQIARVAARRQELRQEIRALDDDAVAPEEVREALAAFEPLWGQLVVRERIRLLDLLIEQVTYDGRTAEVEITFRSGGLRRIADRRSA